MAALYEEAVRRSEGVIAANGPLVCSTGQHTGRSPNDKFIVKEPSSEKHVAWGKVNRPIDDASFDGLLARMQAYVAGQGPVRAGLLGRRRSGLPSADSHHHRARLAQPVRAALFIPEPTRPRSGATSRSSP